MSSYLLVGSEDPFTSADGRRVYDLAGALAGHGDDVTVYLVQNGVLPLRKGSAMAPDVRALTAHAAVLADDFSLRERAIGTGDVVEGVDVAPIEALVDAVMDRGRKVLWL